MINHEILSTSDMGSKFAGDSVTSPKLLTKYGGLPFKLRLNDVCGEINNILEEFFSGRKKRFALNGKCLSWADICYGVPQGSILLPFLFLI